MRFVGLASGLLAIGLAGLPAWPLETDQFYAWSRPLEDATDAINERINADIAEALDRVNIRRDPSSCPCRMARTAIRERFAYAIFGRAELWVTKSALVDRIPESPDEEPTFRRAYLYGGTSPLDPILWMPPSPTIELAGVRIGADKLTHFFSEGALAERSYRRARKRGASDAEALRAAVGIGIIAERTILGLGASGVMSLADLEANYQGLLFYRGLCDGPDPALVRSPTGWRLKRPFDLRDYLSPEWDESWEPNIYSRSRWAKVKPVMARYCELLQSPAVQRRRAAYAARERETLSEAIVRQLVASGELEDPRQFTIEAACGVAPTAVPLDSGR